DFDKYEKKFDYHKFKFDFKLSKAQYELDALQNGLLQLYLYSDRRFRRAFSMNYTPQLIQFTKDKTRLHEPVHISILGQIRGGKSYAAITYCIIHEAFYNRLFHPDYICGNAFEFIDKLQKYPKEKLVDRIFLIDEEKQSVYGVGSVAKKMKITDTQNIIAINNISTIMINPTGWANKDAHYGLRVFGRCFNTKTVRLMLYNLQEKGKGGEAPLGNVYLPIFTEFSKNEYGEWLEKKYLEKKNKWVDMERRGEGDVLETLKKKTAINFVHDPKFKELTTKADRINYITLKMGSEWTRGEIEMIEGYAKLIRDNIIDEDELK
ncbi:MAG: hypothetical protein ACFFDN_06985, partial [Candidatus Hodarchaeota archaeon]